MKQFIIVAADMPVATINKVILPFWKDRGFVKFEWYCCYDDRKVIVCMKEE